MQKKNGFTLIDALVILAILALLISMMLGGLGVCQPQSRWRSRLTGKDLILKAPDDLASVRDIIGFSVDSKGHKNLAYISKDGKFRVKEYTNWGIFQGNITLEFSKGEPNAQ